MAQYHKKPIIVEAEQFLSTKPLPFRDAGVVRFDGARSYVETIHGQPAYLNVGDWVIRETGTEDRAYPCKPDIFDKTYELVREEQG